MDFQALIEGKAIEPSLASFLIDDYNRFATGLPRPVEEYVLDRYQLDLSSEYGGMPVKNPFGKASGQLSLNVQQVRRDADAGLGFVVLKTIIAEDEEGGQSMSEWAIHETRMLVERLSGSDGTTGWNVTWKGRGWYDTFDAYLKFFADSLAVGNEARMLIVPSCKYHLPRPEEESWRVEEYNYTTRRLHEIWEEQMPGAVMPIEKDFSPTLAGSDRAAQVNTINRWLTVVTGLMHRATQPKRISVGLKLFNAMFEDSFQVEMLRLVSEECLSEERPDFLIYANRLFNPNREFDGQIGVAYGGPDLSRRNLAVMAQLRALEQRGEIASCELPISATGNIDSGAMATEYLLRGASTFQMHTFFQLPSSEYRMQAGTKTERALHELYFNPQRGLIACLLRLRRFFDWPPEWNVRHMAEFCADPANKLWASFEPIYT